MHLQFLWRVERGCTCVQYFVTLNHIVPTFIDSTYSLSNHSSTVHWDNAISEITICYIARLLYKDHIPGLDPLLYITLSLHGLVLYQILKQVSIFSDSPTFASEGICRAILRCGDILILTYHAYHHMSYIQNVCRYWIIHQCYFWHHGACWVIRTPNMNQNMSSAVEDVTVLFHAECSLLGRGGVA